jgi:hypothetical protein
MPCYSRQVLGLRFLRLLYADSLDLELSGFFLSPFLRLAVFDRLFVVTFLYGLLFLRFRS